MSAKLTAVPASSSYAASEDFCAIFQEDMNRLYLMALLLTGSQERAEQCFTAALEDCRERRDIFAEWARTWSRRAIVKQAMRLTPPFRTQTEVAEMSDEGDPIGRVMQLPTFERFVFVMAVLEHYSLHECAALLNCRLVEVEAARSRALRLAASHALIAVHEAAGQHATVPALRAS